MAKKAFTLLYGREQDLTTTHRPPMLPLEEEYNLRTRPSLWANMELGNIYSGSLYLSLAGLLERGEHTVENAHLGLFSYGSGCCSEFFTGRFGNDANHWKNRIGIGNGLKKRTELSYEDYLEYMQATSKLEENGSYTYGKEIVSAKHNLVSFCGIQNHQRIYAWSEAISSTQKKHRFAG
jgi:3-hydroxy-3-methylglutaryl CoA synthase